MKINLKNIGATGPAIVFFHGWGFDLSIWNPLIPILDKQNSLYLVDLPGFGETDFMPWDSFKNALLAKLPDKFVLVGWSLGGLLATRLALDKPTRVSHLINVASSPYFIKTDTWPGIERKVLKNFFLELKSSTKKTQENFIKAQLKGINFKGLSNFTASPEGLTWGLELLHSLDLREHLASLQLPTCYFFGALDSIIPKRTMYLLEKLHPNFTFIMDNKAAHLPFLSDLNKFIHELELFIR